MVHGQVNRDPPDYLSRNDGYLADDLNNPLLKPLEGNGYSESLLKFQDPHSYLSNDNSKAFVGTLYAMCSNKEFNQKIQMNTANDLERNGERHVHYGLTLKSFQRSDASRVFKPEDVRPAIWCRRTLFNILCYFVDADVIKKPYLMDKNFSFLDVYNFLRDRIRSIWQDLTVQHCTRHRAYIECFEISIRFLIYSNEVLCGNEEYDISQNLGLLNTCLDKLMDGYTDVHSLVDNITDTKGKIDTSRSNELNYTEIMKILAYESPYEAEFWSYRLLLLIPQLLTPGSSVTFCDICQRMTEHVKKSDLVQFSICVCLAVSSGNVYSFFELMKSADCHPLQAALMNRFSGCVRVRFLYDIITRNIVRKSTNPMNLAIFNTLFGFDKASDDAIVFLSRYNITVSEYFDSEEIKFDQVNVEKLIYDNGNLGKISGKIQVSSAVVRDKINLKFPSRQLLFDPDFELPFKLHDNIYTNSIAIKGNTDTHTQFECKPVENNIFTLRPIHDIPSASSHVNEMDSRIYKRNINEETSIARDKIYEPVVILSRNSSMGIGSKHIQCTFHTNTINPLENESFNSIDPSWEEYEKDKLVSQSLNILSLSSFRLCKSEDLRSYNEYKIHKLDYIMELYFKKRTQRCVTLYIPSLVSSISSFELNICNSGKFMADLLEGKSRSLMEYALSGQPSLTYKSELRKSIPNTFNKQTTSINDVNNYMGTNNCKNLLDNEISSFVSVNHSIVINFVILSISGSLKHLFRIYTTYLGNIGDKFIIRPRFKCEMCNWSRGLSDDHYYFANASEFVKTVSDNISYLSKLLLGYIVPFHADKRLKSGENVVGTTGRHVVGYLTRFIFGNINTIFNLTSKHTKTQNHLDFTECSITERGIFLDLDIFDFCNKYNNNIHTTKLGNVPLNSMKSHLESDYCLRMKQDILRICGLNIAIMDLLQGSCGYKRRTFELYKGIISYKSKNGDVYKIPILIRLLIDLRDDSSAEYDIINKRPRDDVDNVIKFGNPTIFNSHTQDNLLGNILTSREKNDNLKINKSILVMVCSQPLFIGENFINNIFSINDENLCKLNVSLPSTDTFFILSYLFDEDSVRAGSHKQSNICLLCYRLSVSNLDMLTLYELFNRKPPKQFLNCRCICNSRSICYKRFDRLISDIESLLMSTLLRAATGYNMDNVDTIKKRIAFACIGFELHVPDIMSNVNSVINTNFTTDKSTNRIKVTRQLYPFGLENALINIGLL